MDCKRDVYLFLRQEHSCIALLAIIHLCLTLCKDRFPVMYEGAVVTESVVKTEIGAWWIVLGEAVPEISQNLGAYLSDCSTPYLQQLNLLAADTNGSASHQKIHQKISSWPVVNLSKWQVGMLTGMAFGFFHWKNAVVDHGRWLSKMKKYWCENEKCNLNLSDLAFLLDCYFHFFFLLKIKFLDTEREIHAAPHVTEKLIQLFRNKSEFTFLATLQQKASTSGVILSIRELEHR